MSNVVPVRPAATHVLQMPWRRPPLSLNQRMHWRQVHNWKKQIHNDVLTMARAMQLPKEASGASVVLAWYPADQRRRDTDNPTPTLKAAIDALVLYGLVADDSSEFVESRCEIRGVVKFGRVDIEVTVR